jgi:predicted TIM-barrel fold metal-dependent hydrolase
MEMIWANSGDSHFLEPEDLFRRNLRPDLAERMPRSEWEGDIEIVHVDGQVFRRRPPRVRGGEHDGKSLTEVMASSRPPGASDARQRLEDHDEEGVWGEVIFPSLGMWSASITDPLLIREGVKVLNDWALAEIQSVSPRFVCAASASLLSVHDAVAEVARVADLGFKALFMPVQPPPGQDAYNRDTWEPLWTALEDAGLVLAFHVGTEPHDAGGQTGVYHRGPGGAVLNYVETTYGGQRAVSQLIASGVLDRHPDLKVLVSEGGAAWGPFLGDRMNEAYRQHGFFVWPTLSMLPSEFLERQVYASFQHDRTAVAAVTAMGWNNVMWGSDYPHLEGTYGHTQKTLHDLFDGVADDVRYRMTQGAFLELFPHVGPAPAASS